MTREMWAGLVRGKMRRVTKLMMRMTKKVTTAWRRREGGVSLQLLLLWLVWAAKHVGGRRGNLKDDDSDRYGGGQHEHGGGHGNGEGKDTSGDSDGGGSGSGNPPPRPEPRPEPRRRRIIQTRPYRYQFSSQSSEFTTPWRAARDARGAMEVIVRGVYQVDTERVMKNPFKMWDLEGKNVSYIYVAVVVLSASMTSAQSIPRCKAGRELTAGLETRE